MHDDRARLVYSTEHSIPKPDAGNAVETRAALSATQRLLVRLDRKGRGGKSVTLIEELSLPMKEKEVLLKHLKTKLGTGGAIKDACLELQGDHRDAVMTILEGMGLKPKRSGG
jgi:translation initiation factor 1